MDHTVFVTGGAGYIGSHCIVSLLEAGYDVVAIDNFVNSVSETDSDGAQTAPSLDRVQQITGKSLKFMQCDLLDMDSLRKVFSQVVGLKSKYEFHISDLFFYFGCRTRSTV